MALRTIDHFFRTYQEAVEAVADLTAAGVPADDITLIESEADPRLPREVVQDTAQSPAGTGATMGAVLGGGIGVLAGVGAIAIPFLAPLVDAGWIVPTITLAGVGAVLGAAIGSITKVGVTNRRAHAIAEGLQRGQHLVLVQTDEFMAPHVEAILLRARTGPAGPDTAWSMEPVADFDTPAQERAVIHREERDIQYKI
jgi:hypothetical protein